MPTTASATTFVDTTYRNRFPCGRYHRAKILHTKLRSSLPPTPRLPACEVAAEPTPPTPESESPKRLGDSPPPPPAENEAAGRLGGLRRIFSSRKPQKEPVKSVLKPLVLPDRHGLNRTRSASAPLTSSPSPAPADSTKPKGRRLSFLAGWLPAVVIRAKPEAPEAKPSSPRLKPLILPRRSCESSVLPPPEAENSNIVGWLLDCIQRDVIPQWNVLPLQYVPQMLLQDGQAKCLVVRAKRRSALF